MTIRQAARRVESLRDRPASGRRVQNVADAMSSSRTAPPADLLTDYYGIQSAVPQTDDEDSWDDDLDDDEGGAVGGDSRSRSPTMLLNVAEIIVPPAPTVAGPLDHDDFRVDPYVDDLINRHSVKYGAMLSGA